MKTVVEFKLFTGLAEDRLSRADLKALVDFVSCESTAGDLIPGSGGVRKLRWAGSGRGKSGGARVITYTHCAACPVFLITIYLKNDRVNLSQSDIAALYRLAKDLAYGHR